MTRAELEHLIRASADIANDDAFIRDVLRHGLANEATARERLAATVLAPETRRRVEATIAAGFAAPQV